MNGGRQNLDCGLMRYCSTFWYMVTDGSEKRTPSNQFIKPNSHALKC